MAGIRRSTLPVVSFGRSAAGPAVTITENAQFRINKRAYVDLGSPKLLALDFDDKTRMLKVVNYDGKPLPKGWVEADLFQVHQSKDKETGEARDQGGYLAGMSPVWSQIGYDAKASGNQTFVPEIKDGKMALGPIPEGALTPKPKQVRTKKADKPAVAAKATAASAGEVDLSL